MTSDPGGVRPSWDSLWMDFAFRLSQRSTCSRASVGCVVVSEDNHRVLAVGYNGGAKGVFNECKSSEPGQCGHLHAEINAVIKLDYNEPAGKKVYVTMMPCFNCAVALVNAGVKEVVYSHTYRKTDGVELLEQAGIKVRRYEGDVPLKEDGAP